MASPASGVRTAVRSTCPHSRARRVSCVRRVLPSAGQRLRRCWRRRCSKRSVTSSGSSSSRRCCGRSSCTTANSSAGSRAGPGSRCRELIMSRAGLSHWSMPGASPVPSVDLPALRSASRPPRAAWPTPRSRPRDSRHPVGGRRPLPPTWHSAPESLPAPRRRHRAARCGGRRSRCRKFGRSPGRSARGGWCRMGHPSSVNVPASETELPFAKRDIESVFCS